MPEGSKPKELKLCGTKDNIYKQAQYPKPFSFHEGVAEVFDDMITRSVPFYEQNQNSVLDWVDAFYQKDQAIYDIGCSTGTSLHHLAEYFAKHKRLKLRGIDNSSAMLQRAEKKLTHHHKNHDIELIYTDACSHNYSQAGIFLLNYTLQFIAVQSRKKLLRKIYQSLETGGLCYLSEKVGSSRAEVQEIFSKTYEQYKKQAGYTQNEIARKKEALENVLIPMTVEEYTDLMKQCGFKHVECILRWNNFATLIAIK